MISGLSLGSAYLAADKSSWIFALGSRSGGQNNRHSLDDLFIGTGGLVPARVSLIEDVAGDLIFAGAPFADADGDSLTVTLEAVDGTFSVQSANGVSVGGTASMRTISGSATALNTLFTTPGSVTYQGALNNSADRTITVRLSDGVLSSSVSSQLVFAPVNDAPVANAQSVTVTEDTAQAITLTGTDPEGSALTYTVASQPTKGVLSGTAPNLTYTPNADANGADAFTFSVSDGTMISAVATVSLTVTPVNDAPTLDLGISAAGGAKTASGEYTVHTFTDNSDTFTPAASGVVEVLVVGGGGGGGGSYVGGGGGGGGVLSSTSYAVTAGESISVLVGGGGKGGAFGTRGGTGGTSRFGSLVAVGGGGGGSFGPNQGLGGGSGGGAGWQGVAGAGVVGQGLSGGAFGTTPSNHGGGGGGAGGTPDSSGVGGVGVSGSISGSTVYYAGGGAAGTDHSVRLAGGLGGGGDGGTWRTDLLALVARILLSAARQVDSLTRRGKEEAPAEALASGCAVGPPDRPRSRSRGVRAESDSGPRPLLGLRRSQSSEIVSPLAIGPSLSEWMAAYYCTHTSDARARARTRTQATRARMQLQCPW